MSRVESMTLSTPHLHLPDYASCLGRAHARGIDIRVQGCGGRSGVAVAVSDIRQVGADDLHGGRCLYKQPHVVLGRAAAAAARVVWTLTSGSKL